MSHPSSPKKLKEGSAFISQLLNAARVVPASQDTPEEVTAKSRQALRVEKSDDGAGKAASSGAATKATSLKGSHPTQSHMQQSERQENVQGHFEGLPQGSAHAGLKASTTSGGNAAAAPAAVERQQSPCNAEGRKPGALISISTGPTVKSSAGQARLNRDKQSTDAKSGLPSSPLVETLLSDPAAAAAAAAQPEASPMESGQLQPESRTATPRTIPGLQHEIAQAPIPALGSGTHTPPSGSIQHAPGHFLHDGRVSGNLALEGLLATGVPPGFQPPRPLSGSMHVQGERSGPTMPPVPAGKQMQMGISAGRPTGTSPVDRLSQPGPPPIPSGGLAIRTKAMAGHVPPNNPTPSGQITSSMKTYPEQPLSHVTTEAPGGFYGSAQPQQAIISRQQQKPQQQLQQEAVLGRQGKAVVQDSLPGPSQPGPSSTEPPRPSIGSMMKPDLQDLRRQAMLHLQDVRGGSQQPPPAATPRSDREPAAASSPPPFAAETAGAAGRAEAGHPLLSQPRSEAASEAAQKSPSRSPSKEEPVANQDDQADASDLERLKPGGSPDGKLQAGADAPGQEAAAAVASPALTVAHVDSPLQARAQASGGISISMDMASRSGLGQATLQGRKTRPGGRGMAGPGRMQIVISSNPQQEASTEVAVFPPPAFAGIGNLLDASTLADINNAMRSLPGSHGMSQAGPEAYQQSAAASTAAVYSSPLSRFRSYRLCETYQAATKADYLSATYGNTVDAQWPLCPYEARGSCRNPKCPYQMPADYTLEAVQIVRDIFITAQKAGSKAAVPSKADAQKAGGLEAVPQGI